MQAGSRRRDCPGFASVNRLIPAFIQCRHAQVVVSFDVWRQRWKAYPVQYSLEFYLSIYLKTAYPLILFFKQHYFAEILLLFVFQIEHLARF